MSKLQQKKLMEQQDTRAYENLKEQQEVLVEAYEELKEQKEFLIDFLQKSLELVGMTHNTINVILKHPDSEMRASLEGLHGTLENMRGRFYHALVTDHGKPH